MRRCLGCLLCLLLLWSRPAQAQIPVTDASVGAQTTISAIQNVIMATNMVLSVANQALELTPLDEIRCSPVSTLTIAKGQSTGESEIATSHSPED
jgi:hypothetical protein